MFENEQLTARLTSLFGEAKRALDVEWRYIGVSTTQKLSRLLAGMALVAVLLLVGSIVLLFASFALAYWVAELTDSMLLGFGMLALVLLLACVVVYLNRRAWIQEPILRAVAQLFVNEDVDQTPAGISIESQRLQDQRQQTHAALRQQADVIVQPAKRTASKWERATSLISTAIAIYEGLTVGRSTISALRRVIKGKK